MKINVITLCSGYDSQCMALDRIKEAHPDFDYELIAWCEIDRFAIASHNAIYPQWADRNLGDMTKVDWSSIKEPIDLLTYSTPCLTEDSLILTRNGYVQMRDVKVGDLVLTRSGKWHPVVKKFDNGVHGTYYINALGFENIHCTGNHKFLVRTMKRKWNNEERRYHRTFSEPEFKDALDIRKGDYFGLPVIQSSRFPEWQGITDGRGTLRNSLRVKFHLESFWYMMGRYVGDGWRREGNTSKGIVISCGGRNEERLKEAFERSGYSYTRTEERTCVKYSVYSCELSEFVKRYGQYAHGKRIDGETMMLPWNLLKAFVDGCMDSDGCFTQNHFKYSTVSRELAYSIAYCISRVYGRHCAIHKTERPAKTTIEGREANQRDSYEVVFTKEPRKQDQAFYEDGYIWYPFRYIEKAEDEHVYNMEVEEDHSYIVQGCISKNCQDISNAGLQRGLGEGTRSGILWDTERAIEILRPKYLMQENVKALVGKRFMPDFKRWCKILEDFGYTNFWKVLNAKDYGVPQNRERVFMISVLDCNFKYEFPEPIPLDKTVEDVLEDEADECYFLRDEQVERFLDRVKEENK